MPTFKRVKHPATEIKEIRRDLEEIKLKGQRIERIADSLRSLFIGKEIHNDNTND